MNKEKIHEYIDEQIKSTSCLKENYEVFENIFNVLKNARDTGKQVFVMGNGGSAADAQHIAAELSGRFFKERKPLFAEALHVNTSFVTAVANDYGYDHIYSRMVEAAGKNLDILIGISTSGNSKNVVNAILKAKEIGMFTVGFTGESSCEMDQICDTMIKIPSINTPRIQEAHILIGHIICQLIEEELF